MSPGLIVLVLSLLLGLQPITTDLYLPALPAMTQGFGASLSQAQLTLTALLLAFGISQLVWGPLSDRFGRRPVIIIGALLAAPLYLLGDQPWLAGVLTLLAWVWVTGALHLDGLGDVADAFGAAHRDPHRRNQAIRGRRAGARNDGEGAGASAPASRCLPEVPRTARGRRN